MNFPEKSSMEAGEKGLEQVLGDFRASVHAWSAAEFNNPRAMNPRAMASLGRSLAHRRSWRVVLGTALGCVMAAGSLAGGLYQRHQREEIARIAAQRNLEIRQQVAVEERAQADEQLLAGIDSDVSREVPSAMEPLAQLMEGAGDQ